MARRTSGCCLDKGPEGVSLPAAAAASAAAAAAAAAGAAAAAAAVATVHRFRHAVLARGADNGDETHRPIVERADFDRQPGGRASAGESRVSGRAVTVARLLSMRGLGAAKRRRSVVRLLISIACDGLPAPHGGVLVCCFSGLKRIIKAARCISGRVRCRRVEHTIAHVQSRFECTFCFRS